MAEEREPSQGSPAWARLRLALVLIGVLFFAALAVLATLYFLGSAISVLRNMVPSGSVGGALLAVLVVLVGGLWVIVVARYAGRSPRSAAIAAVAAFATLVIVRFVIVAMFDADLAGEPGVYASNAKGIAEGPCCPWDEPIFRPPGYPFLLAAAYTIAGRSASSAEALNIIFAMGSGLFVFLLARGLYGARIAAVALLSYALWPAGALMVAVPLPHTSYEFAIIAAAWAVVATPPGWRGSLLGGVLLGLSQYLRPSTLILLPVFILARVWGGGRWRRVLGGGVLPMVLAYLLVLVPIMAWNYSTRGAVDVTTSAHGGISLYHGTNQDSGGTWSRQASDLFIELAGEDGDIWDRSRVAQELALERIQEDPLGVAALAVRKQAILWGGESYGVRYAIKRSFASRPYLPGSVVPSLASGAFYALLLMATTAGLYLRRREVDALMALLVLTILAVSVTHGFLEVRDRYHSYVIPLMFPIAAVAIVAAVDRLPRRRTGPPDVEASVGDPGSGDSAPGDQGSGE